MSTDMPATMKIGIVGLGLIGGSLAKALKRAASPYLIYAMDKDSSALKKGLDDHAIDVCITDPNDLACCDVVFLCISPGDIIEWIQRLDVFFTGIVTDTASTKERICRHVKKHHPYLRFVPGHPMAGSEKTGYDASTESLFENAPYLLCHFADPSQISAQQAGPDVELIRNIAESIGARPYLIRYELHDRFVGLISHLPHILAYALVNLVEDEGEDILKEIAAGGFRDITRIASSDPALWADILMESSDSASDILESYISSLQRIADYLNRQDKAALYRIFKQAKEYRDHMLIPTSKQLNLAQIWVDVDDKPGMIGKIAVLLGDHGINIKNITIQDNREYEGGSMRITLSSVADAQQAGRIFEKENLSFRIIR